MNRSDQEVLIRDMLERAESVPAMPSVATEVLRLTRDETSTLDDLTEVLSLDPALSGKLMRLANSSLFTRGTPVTTLKRATAMLGTKTVKLMALSFVVAGALPRGGKSSLCLVEYWRRSVVRAVAARLVASSFRSKVADEAFLGGLLSRLGQLVLAVCLSDEYERVIRASDGRWPTSECERECLGFDGYAVSSTLLRSWSLPELICNGVYWSSDPGALPDDAAPEVVELARILDAASWLEELVCARAGAAAVGELKARAQTYFGLSDEDVDEVMGCFDEALAETSEMLELEVGVDSMEEILQRAQAQLVEQSVQIALEAQGLRELTAQLADHNRSLHVRASTDSVTQLPNRVSFDQTVERCVEERRAGRGRGELGLLIIDIDHFKNINDTYGHQTGDEVLKRVGEVIRSMMRENDLAARYGGDEFAAVFPEISGAGVASVSERIRAAVESARIEHGGAALSVTVSVGGAHGTMRSAADSTKALIEAADGALYEAKRGGRNRFSITEFDSGSA